MRKTILTLCLLLFAASSLAQPSIRLSRVSWEAGRVAEGKLLKEKITISNPGSQVLEVNLRSGCSCITFDKTIGKIAPGREKTLTIIFNTKGKQGKLTEYIYFDTNDPEFPYLTFIAEADVAGKPADEKVPVKKVLSQGSVEGRIQISMFSSPGCATCRKLKEDFIPKLAKEHNLAIKIKHFLVDKKENYEKLIALEDSLDDRNNKLPALVIGGKILGGDREIKAELGNTLASIREKGLKEFFGKEVAQSAKEVSPGAGNIRDKINSVQLLPIIGAGLLDGINPCAFATIIFFISYLSFAGKGGKEILGTGIAFTLAIFLCYTLIGLGLFKGFEKLTEVPFVSLIIKIITVSMVFVLGVLSVYDYIKCRQGKPADMKLQLSPLLKEKIHKSIVSKREDFAGKNSGVFKLVLAGFSVGVLVSIFEFACTGQIYLPTIMYMLKIPGLRFGALGYLLLYNLMFVAPLIIIFILAWKGITSEQFTNIMLKHLSKIKIGMAVFFFGMGILLIYT